MGCLGTDSNRGVKESRRRDERLSKERDVVASGEDAGRRWYGGSIINQMGLKIRRKKAAKNLKALKETIRIASRYETQTRSNLQWENKGKRP